MVAPDPASGAAANQIAPPYRPCSPAVLPNQNNTRGRTGGRTEGKVLVAPIGDRPLLGGQSRSLSIVLRIRPDIGLRNVSRVFSSFFAELVHLVLKSL